MFGRSKKRGKQAEERAEASKPIRSVSPAAEEDSGFAVDASRGFVSWLETQNASLAVTTYQAGKILFFGVDDKKSLWVHNRNIGRCLGLACDENGFWVTSDAQFYRFANLMNAKSQQSVGSDALFAPRYSYFTGDLDIHDVAIDKDGQPIFVNTLFNCLARPSLTSSFEPVWKPPFITKFIAEDRCHLNGLAMVEGAPAYVTATSQSDTYDGWREDRNAGGIVMDVRSNEVVSKGLSMPHSPRWHNDRLYLNNSGTGEFGYIDTRTGKFEPIAFCPGYLRGLDFIGDVAVVGLSMPRDNRTFNGLPLDQALSDRSVSAKSGLYFIDLVSGNILHSLTFRGVVTELYDVRVMPGLLRPSAIGPNSPEVRRMLSLG